MMYMEQLSFPVFFCCFKTIIHKKSELFHFLFLSVAKKCSLFFFTVAYYFLFFTGNRWFVVPNILLLIKKEPLSGSFFDYHRVPF